ncbi:hypothetical protein [Thermodesulfatator autotrophicus]|uniref:Uncharacterized protein n=1 Tax=Thermodesulfatator autotrophicus TaxID=1795632 RepID=A0A177E8Y1_9BACT|nr:hypothetical protein [Thermodesulfatator autotrophicus]OAG28258.1 hypothetical protein TH606_02590 [Thermodesulfatator autotrophicus]
MDIEEILGVIAGIILAIVLIITAWAIFSAYQLYREGASPPIVARKACSPIKATGDLTMSALDALLPSWGPIDTVIAGLNKVVAGSVSLCEKTVAGFLDKEDFQFSPHSPSPEQKPQKPEGGIAI